MCTEVETLTGPLPTIAIVGRPNVGKSSLFNRITGTRDALVHDMSGVTRDRLYGVVAHEGRGAQLVDTGGLLPESDTAIEEHVRDQVYLALEEAEVILFVVDGDVGCIGIDEDIADLLRRQKKPVLLVVNKVDAPVHEYRTGDFQRLGFREVHAISATHARGVEELLDAAFALLPEAPPSEARGPLKIALVGRPNVGKSSLVNKLVDEDRLIVSDVAGTTREAVEVPFRTSDGAREMVLVDTAGIKRKSKVRKSVERLSRYTSERALRRSDVVALLLDASVPLTHADKVIAGMIQDAGRPTVLVLNKIDLFERPHEDLIEWFRELDRLMPWFAFAPRVALSALEGKGTGNLIATLEEVVARFDYRIPTAQLNRLLREATIVHPPPIHRGRALKILYAVQAPDRPASFVLKVNDPDAVHFSFRRYLENTLRNMGDFEGLPLRLRFEERSGRKQRGESDSEAAARGIEAAERKRQQRAAEPADDEAPEVWRSGDPREDIPGAGERGPGQSDPRDKGRGRGGRKEAKSVAFHGKPGGSAASPDGASGSKGAGGKGSGGKGAATRGKGTAGGGKGAATRGKGTSGGGKGRGAKASPGGRGGKAGGRGGKSRRTPKGGGRR